MQDHIDDAQVKAKYERGLKHHDPKNRHVYLMNEEIVDIMK